VRLAIAATRASGNAAAAPIRLTPEAIAERLDSAQPFPDGFTFPEIERDLRRAHPSREACGLTIFFTGLSGSGKSTVANALRVRLLEDGRRQVTLLDGDLVRQHLSSELGFSREHRVLNVRRIAVVAAEIARHRGVAICAPIAPYDAVRRQARELAEAAGAFLLIHMATPIEVCESRDPKGLYAQARAGRLPEFTGVSDPYEPPRDADLTIDSSQVSVTEAVDAIIRLLDARGYLAASAQEWPSQ
jgi:sulfate adenylyltransferase